MSSLSIGEVARAAGVGVETLRFYEREGLLPKPPRRASGYRQYPPDAVRRVRFIRRAKDLGFSLDEIGDLLALRVTPGAPCADVRALAQTKLADIDRRLASLARMRGVLAGLARACSNDAAPTQDCPILAALEDTEDFHAAG